MAIDICLNGHGAPDEPYVVRCVKAFELLNEWDEDGSCGYIYVDEGSEWEISSPSYESDYMLEGNGWVLDLSERCLNEHFELVHEGGCDED